MLLQKMGCYQRLIILTFFVLLFLNKNALAGYRLACRYFDTTSSSQNTSFLHPGLPWLWARGEQNEYIYVEGKKIDGFFEVSSMNGKSSLPFSKFRPVIYENSSEGAKKYCKNALRKAFPHSYYKKRILNVAVKSSFLSMNFLSPVFSTNNQQQGGEIDRVVIFGDSLSDQGNLKNWLRVFPPEPYFAGRFSNGPNWVDYMQMVTGVAIQNWAVGGSLSSPHLDDEFDQLTFKESAYLSAQLAITGNIGNEIEKYKKLINEETIKKIDSTLFVIWIGGNDYFTWLDSVKDADIFIDVPNNPRAGSNTIINAVTRSIDSHLRTLYKAGARKFMVVNLPDLGTTPKILDNKSYHLNIKEPASKRVISLSEGLTRISKTHNYLLKQIANAFRDEYSDTKLTIIEADRVMEDSFELLEQFSKAKELDFGFDKTFVKEFYHEQKFSIINKACYTSKFFSTPTKFTCEAPNSKLFWDSIHPTTYPHCLFANYIHKNLSKVGFFYTASTKDYLGICNPELL
ncbi:MAG: SGNH/GDSL hydrolase family protein [Myxococcales bacterium]|nr:SGNH/GDSL hydrolase family protein [Myxococcales bacterium]USN50947.1 MAG: SGNH/GDSL hydrolase family protein [Myxococcales bacterium]